MCQHMLFLNSASEAEHSVCQPLYVAKWPPRPNSLSNCRDNNLASENRSLHLEDVYHRRAQAQWTVGGRGVTALLDDVRGFFLKRTVLETHCDRWRFVLVV